LQFLWGNVCQLSKTFELEFYYGVGLRGVMVRRADVVIKPVCDGPEENFWNVPETNFYVRPSAQAGVKLKIVL